MSSIEQGKDSLQSFQNKQDSVKSVSRSKSSVEPLEHKKSSRYSVFEKKLKKPENQLNLSPNELHELIPRILKINNPEPSIIQNTVRFNYKERCFKQTQPYDGFNVLFQLEGNYIHNDSLEAKLQYQRIRTDSAVRNRYVRMKSMEVRGSQEGDDGDDDSDENSDEEPGQRAERKRKEALRKKKLDKKMKKQKSNKTTAQPDNRYDSNARHTQVILNAMKDNWAVTEQPDVVHFSANATQNEIFDAYAANFKQEQMLKRLAEKRMISRNDKLQKEKQNKKYAVDRVVEKFHSDAKKMCMALEIIERILSQNKFDETIQDFKYWEDKADEFRENGALLPLWKFKTSQKKLIVNSIQWNPKYPDLFAVALGPKSFEQQNFGSASCYSLKSTEHHVYTYETSTGCVSVDFHPKYVQYLAVGLYDGSVFVLNLGNKKVDEKLDIIKPSSYLRVHNEPVWQIRWDRDDVNENLNFLSLSSDGQIFRWTLLRNELHSSFLINFKAVHITKPDEFFGNLITGCCTCLDLNPHNDYLYLVGTEEGLVHRCSKGYRNQVQFTYYAHSMAVYAVKWNPFYPKYFLSCSSDCSIKLWDYTLKDPLNSFDVGNAVVDVAWAYHSSTVFAGLTLENELFVYDMNVDRYEPMCRQRICKQMRSKSTRLLFNPVYPILIASDNKGSIFTLKLSPNLRRKPKEPINRNNLKKVEVESEVAKIERVLQGFIDPDMLSERMVRSLFVDKPKEKPKHIVEQDEFSDDEKKNDASAAAQDEQKANDGADGANSEEQQIEVQDVE